MLPANLRCRVGLGIWLRKTLAGVGICCRRRPERFGFTRRRFELPGANYQVMDQQRLTDALWSLISFPEDVLGVDAAVAFWGAVTIALSALLLIVLVHGFYRARRAAQVPACILPFRRVRIVR